MANQRIDKFSSHITINNDKLLNLANDVSDVQLSIDASQEIIEVKIKTIEERTDKDKQKNIRNFENNNKRLKNKLRDLKDRSRMNNLRFDGVREYANESWNDREVLKDFLLENLGLRNIKIGRAHRTGEKQNKNNKNKKKKKKKKGNKIRQEQL